MLRGRRLDGAKFRRQQPLGPYIVDFFCERAGLVIELDGAPHFPRPRRDQIRDAFLRAAGLTVVRFANREVLDHVDRVLEVIRAKLRAAPLSLRERGWGVRVNPSGASRGLDVMSLPADRAHNAAPSFLNTP